MPMYGMNGTYLPKAADIHMGLPNYSVHTHIHCPGCKIHCNTIRGICIFVDCNLGLDLTYFVLVHFYCSKYLITFFVFFLPCLTTNR